MNRNLCERQIEGFKAAQTPVASPRAWRSAPGLTVIEVLVALVILALGIFAILKIFPVGFGTIDVNRQRAVAAALANAEAERWKQLADSLYYLPSAGLGDNLYSLPEAILATQYDGTVRVDYDSWDVTPAQGDLFSISPARDALLLAPATQPLWEPDSLWAPRTVLGEKTVISDAAEPFHILAVAPLDYLYNAGAVTQTVQVYDPEPFERLDSGPLSDWQFTVAGDGTFTFDANYAGLNFTVSYAYNWHNNVDGKDYVSSVVAEPITLNGSGSGVVAAAGRSGFISVIPESAKAYICYTDEGTYPDPPTQSYYFTCSRITGTILFHSDDARNLVGINYRVYDWAILRQDITVPSTGLANLPLGYIKRAGYTNPPRDLGFSNDFRFQHSWDPDPTIADPSIPRLHPKLNGNVSLVAVDINNPQDIENGWLIDWSDAGPNSMLVNFRTGEINFGAVRAGSTYRVYYRARGDWAVQIQKAAAEYLPSSGAPDGQHFYWGAYDSPTPHPDRLYFARSEAGKVVNISYTASDGTYVTGIVKTIPIASQPFTGSSSYVCPITLASPAPAANLVANGVSLIAKTVWAMPGKSMVPKERTLQWQQKLEDNPSLTPDDLRVEGVVRYAFLNELWNQRSITTSLPTPLR